MDDARRAAEAIAQDPAVRRALVYGSVARGSAGPRSDIDLIVVDADLDYGNRWKRKVEIERIAGEACGCWVEVFVTDEPEWQVRTTEVRSSFEAHIATYAIELAANDDAAEAVNWAKTIGRPDSDAADIAHRLELVGRRVRSLQNHERPSREELQSERDDPADAAELRRDRQTGILGDACQVILAAARVMHAATLGTAPPKGDDLAVLLAQQPSWVSDAFHSAIDRSGAVLSEMHYWRDRYEYRPGESTRRVDPAGAAAAANAAHAVLGWTLDQLDLDAEVLDRYRRYIAHRQRRLDEDAAVPSVGSGPQAHR